MVDLLQPAGGQLTDAVTNATFDEVRQPVAFAATVKMPRSAAHLPVLAFNSMGA